MSLVRSGRDAYDMTDGTTRRTAQQAIEGRTTHTTIRAYQEMLFQITLDYASLPNPLEMNLATLVFFYEGRRHALHKLTKPK